MAKAARHGQQQTMTRRWLSCERAKTVFLCVRVKSLESFRFSSALPNERVTQRERKTTYLGLPPVCRFREASRCRRRGAAVVVPALAVVRGDPCLSAFHDLPDNLKGLLLMLLILLLGSRRLLLLRLDRRRGSGSSFSLASCRRPRRRRRRRCFPFVVPLSFALSILFLILLFLRQRRRGRELPRLEIGLF